MMFFIQLLNVFDDENLTAQLLETFMEPFYRIIAKGYEYRYCQVFNTPEDEWTQE